MKPLRFCSFTGLAIVSKGGRPRQYVSDEARLCSQHLREAARLLSVLRPQMTREARARLKSELFGMANRDALPPK